MINGFCVLHISSGVTIATQLSGTTGHKIIFSKSLWLPLLLYLCIELIILFSYFWILIIIADSILKYVSNILLVVVVMVHT